MQQGAQIPHATHSQVTVPANSMSLEKSATFANLVTTRLILMTQRAVNHATATWVERPVTCVTCSQANATAGLE